MFFVYILTNLNRTVLYTGVTNNLQRRVLEHYRHRSNLRSFTGRYHCYYLIYFESFASIQQAIAREKQIKGWRREKKLALIATDNPGLSFLNEMQFGSWPPDDLDDRSMSGPQVPPSSG